MSLCSSSASRYSFPELRFSRHSRSVRKSQHLGTNFLQGKVLVGHYKQSYRRYYHYRGGKLKHARAFLDDGIGGGGSISPGSGSLDPVERGAGTRASADPSRWCSSDHQEAGTRVSAKSSKWCSGRDTKKEYFVDHRHPDGVSDHSLEQELSASRWCSTGTTDTSTVTGGASTTDSTRASGNEERACGVDAPGWSFSDHVAEKPAKKHFSVTAGDSKVKEEEHNRVFSSAARNEALLNLPQVFQLLSAWDSLSERLAPEILHCNGSQLLLSALKVAVPAFQLVPYSTDGRFHLSRALSIAYTLVDLHMDPEVIASGILRVAMETEALSLSDVERELGAGTFHLLDDSLRVNQLACRLDTLDDDNNSMLREFSLTYHDVRAVVVELAARLDEMRHVDCLPRLRQQIAALENMQLYAPLAHALGLGTISQELEDMAFRILFPDSYQCVENWLQCHWGDGEAIISDSIKLLQSALQADDILQGMVESVKVTGRRKSRFSTMKKLLRDGRSPDQVYDILGLRVIMFPKPGAGEEVGISACYRVQKVATGLWKEVPGRTKDYIAMPKLNGYSSLHLAVYLTENGPWSLPMEIQIRTAAMHAHAVSGASSHALYKGGLTDPRQIENFKTIVLAAAKEAACRFSSDAMPETNSDQLFQMFDKNKDGTISGEEFHEILSQLGASEADSSELLELLDTNTDGSVDAMEFAQLKQQVQASLEENRLRSQIRKNDDFSRRLQHTIQLSVF